MRIIDYRIYETDKSEADSQADTGEKPVYDIRYSQSGWQGLGLTGGLCNGQKK
jgi:hypothetical protein